MKLIAKNAGVNGSVVIEKVCHYDGSCLVTFSSILYLYISLCLSIFILANRCCPMTTLTLVIMLQLGNTRI